MTTSANKLSSRARLLYVVIHRQQQKCAWITCVACPSFQEHIPITHKFSVLTTQKYKCLQTSQQSSCIPDHSGTYTAGTDYKELGKSLALTQKTVKLTWC